MQHPMQSNDFSPLLQPEETILWSEPRRQVRDSLIHFLLVGGGVLLGIYGVQLLEAFFNPDSMDSHVGVRLIFLALSLCCFGLAGITALNHRKQVYVLTQQRAIIARRSARGLRPEHAFPLSPHMLKAIVRHPDGTSSYIFDTLRVSHRTALPLGFMGVQQAAELEAQLTRCGVRISAAEGAGKKSSPPQSVDILFLLLAAGITAFCFLRDAQGDTELMLTLRGEHATATIVGHVQQYHKNGKSDGEWSYAPTLQFCTAEGRNVQATDRFNEQATPPTTGERINILYAPHNPDLVMRAPPSRFIRPGIMLLVFCGTLCMGLSGIYRRYTHRP